MEDKNQTTDPAAEQTFEQKYNALSVAYKAKCEENAGLRTQLAAAQAGGMVKKTNAQPPAIPDTVFNINGQDYKFVIPSFNYKGKRLTAIDALTDESILEDLVTSGSAVVKKVL